LQLAIGVVMAVGLIFSNMSLALAKVNFEGGESLDMMGKTYEDDVMIGGAFVDGDMQVTGDGYVAGNMIDIGGKYGDDLNVAGNQVTIGGEIVDDTKIAGSMVNLNANVGSDAMLAGGQVNVEKAAVINGDLYAAGGYVRLDGDCKNDVYAAGGKVVLSGVVNGNLQVNAEEFSMTSDAKVLGNLNYKAKEELTNLVDGQVGGEVNFSQYTDINANIPSIDTETGAKIGAAGMAGLFGASLAAQVTGFVVGLLMLILTAIVMICLLPGMTHRSSYNFTAKMGWSLLYGLLILIVMPILSVILMVTIVGLPLGIIALVMYFILLYVAKIVAALSIGSAILGRKDQKLSAQIWAALLGLLIVEVVCLIPIVGGLLGFVLMLGGMGAIYIWFTSRHSAN